MAELEVQQLLSLAEALTLPDAGYSASRLDRLAVVPADAHDRRQEGPAVGGVDLVTPQPLSLRPGDRNRLQGGYAVYELQGAPSLSSALSSRLVAGTLTVTLLARGERR